MLAVRTLCQHITTYLLGELSHRQHQTHKFPGKYGQLGHPANEPVRLIVSSYGIDAWHPKAGRTPQASLHATDEALSPHV